MRLVPEEVPVCGESFNWVKNVVVWKQGELDYACGPAALMTAALFIRAIEYKDCDFASLRKAQSCMRALTQGISFDDLNLFANSISSKSDAQPSLRLSLVNSEDAFPKIEEHTGDVRLLRICASYRDPHIWKETPKYEHIVVVFGEKDGRLLVADPHPWADNAISWVTREQLEKSTPETTAVWPHNVVSVQCVSKQEA